MSDSGKAYEWVDKQDQAALKASPRVLAAESYLAGITSRDAEVESLQAELADARISLSREMRARDALQAKLDDVRALAADPCSSGCCAFCDGKNEGWEMVLEILDAAPSSALDAVKAEALEEAADTITLRSIGGRSMSERINAEAAAETWLRARAAVLREGGESE